MRFDNEEDAMTYIFSSMRRHVDATTRGPDEVSRNVMPTRRLITLANLLDQPREYVVVTGSKGKGSTAAITAKLLQHLGHTVGLLTSPHMVDWYERIRVNGRMIPAQEFFRILSDLSPYIDQVEETLTGTQYFSPQGIFLAIALRWWDEQKVNVAVCEVGRGGRFDDVAVVPNELSLFTPIMLEHVNQLGPTLERIAWHKAGVIKAGGYAYSVPQAPEVLDILQAEAEAHGTEFAWIAPMDMGEFVRAEPDGIIMRLGRYGEMKLSFLGQHQIENATLAVQGAGNVHGRLAGAAHHTDEYVAAIRAGLADVRWPGRLQRIDEHPAIWVDGATTVVAARSMLESLAPWLTHPLITIVGTPIDRDYHGVYGVFGPASDALILTENHISQNVRFPAPDVALAAAREHNDDVSFAPTLPEALELARAKSGADGTILIGAALPVVAEALQLWHMTFEVI
ncbi:MAG: hypothetical protein IT320_11920 [Anaerolineae bacterium]|nr:hypothetical protein [Anaerolineae bacterium]